MAVSSEYLEYIVELLSPVGSLQTRRMFGGVLLVVEDKQLGIIIDEIVYFKVISPDLQGKYRETGSVQFSYARKDKNDPVIINNWWSIPDAAVDDGEEMVRLAREVLLQ